MAGTLAMDNEEEKRIEGERKRGREGERVVWRLDVSSSEAERMEECTLVGGWMRGEEFLNLGRAQDGSKVDRVSLRGSTRLSSDSQVHERTGGGMTTGCLQDCTAGIMGSNDRGDESKDS
eukprot:755854-Hanusia_phi.AAC.1